MNKIKQLAQKSMKKMVERAIEFGEIQDFAAIKSPYIIGVWFYEPQAPKQNKRANEK
ncbi:hypothetical protein ACFJXP_11100 [Enterococcus faecalis]